MITFFTIVLNGRPWIERHYEEFRQLSVPWRWIVVDGVAENVKDTNWCVRIAPGNSEDGTLEYLSGLSTDKRVTVLKGELWPGKVGMCNAALLLVDEPCLLWQVDSDELWMAPQIESVVRLFETHPDRNCAYFWCRYFVGDRIMITTRDSWSNNPSYEWLRVWRFQPGMTFKTHEPPKIEGFTERPLTHSETESVGAVFDHHAYATIEQVRFKQRYYSGNHPNGRHYRGLVEAWKRLQENTTWPVRLREFFTFVPIDCVADRL